MEIKTRYIILAVSLAVVLHLFFAWLPDHDISDAHLWAIPLSVAIGWLGMLRLLIWDAWQLRKQGDQSPFEPVIIYMKEDQSIQLPDARRLRWRSYDSKSHCWLSTKIGSVQGEGYVLYSDRNELHLDWPQVLWAVADADGQLEIDWKDE